MTQVLGSPAYICGYNRTLQVFRQVLSRDSRPPTEYINLTKPLRWYPWTKTGVSQDQWLPSIHLLDSCIENIAQLMFFDLQFTCSRIKCPALIQQMLHQLYREPNTANNCRICVYRPWCSYGAFLSSCQNTEVLKKKKKMHPNYVYLQISAMVLFVLGLGLPRVFNQATISDTCPMPGKCGRSSFCTLKLCLIMWIHIHIPPDCYAMYTYTCLILLWLLQAIVCLVVLVT